MSLDNHALAAFEPERPVGLVLVLDVAGKVVAVDALEHAETVRILSAWNAAAIERAAKKAGRKGT